MINKLKSLESYQGFMKYFKNTSWLFVGLFSAIATLGLDGVVVRELVKDESRRDELEGDIGIMYAWYMKAQIR